MDRVLSYTHAFWKVRCAKVRDYSDSSSSTGQGGNFSGYRQCRQYTNFNWHTVDGSEIRRTPVEVRSLSMFIPLFGKVLLIPGGAGFRPSTVVILPSKRNLSCKALLGRCHFSFGDCRRRSLTSSDGIIAFGIPFSGIVSPLRFIWFKASHLPPNKRNLAATCC